MRTNPIRPQDQRSEPNHPRPISEPIFLNLSSPNVSTDGSTVGARSAEGQPSVSTGDDTENAASAEGQPSVRLEAVDSNDFQQVMGGCK